MWRDRFCGGKPQPHCTVLLSPPTPGPRHAARLRALSLIVAHASCTRGRRGDATSPVLTIAAVFGTSKLSEQDIQDEMSTTTRLHPRQPPRHALDWCHAGGVAHPSTRHSPQPDRPHPPPPSMPSVTIPPPQVAPSVLIPAPTSPPPTSPPTDGVTPSPTPPPPPAPHPHPQPTPPPLNPRPHPAPPSCLYGMNVRGDACSGSTGRTLAALGRGLPPQARGGRGRGWWKRIGGMGSGAHTGSFVPQPASTPQKKFGARGGREHRHASFPSAAPRGA